MKRAQLLGVAIAGVCGLGAFFGVMSLIGNKQTRVVKEEVTLSKRQVQETRKVSDTVRREEARIEKTGDSWRGNERRYGNDESYSGPERRVAEV